MRAVGIDIGSRTIEVVVMEEGKIIDSRQTDSGFDPLKEAEEILEGLEFDASMATGYGRHLFELSFDAPTVTEIKAYGSKGPFSEGENHPGYRGAGFKGHRPQR